MSKFISPNELHSAACTHMLSGAVPITRHDWSLVVNFWAANVADGLEADICKVMKMIFDCPLTAAEITKIANYQASHKASLRDLVNTPIE